MKNIYYEIKIEIAIFILLTSVLGLFGVAEINRIFYVLLAIPLIFIFLKALFFAKKRRNNVLWLIFIASLFLSELINHDIFESLVIASIPLIFINEETNLKKVVINIFIGLSPIFLLVLFAYIIGHNFGSNTIGLYTVAFFVSFTAVNFYLETTYFNLISYFGLTFITFIILKKINSRGALLIFLVVLMIFIFYTFNDKIKLAFANKINMTISFIISILIILITYLFLKNNVLSSKWLPDDISTGRITIWRTTLQNLKIFGHNYLWYEKSGLFKSFGPHNFFISLLGYGGYIPFLTMVLILWKTLNKLYIKKFNEFDVSYLIIFMFLMASLTKGLTENLLLTSPFNIFSLFLLIAINYDNPVYVETTVPNRIVYFILFILIMAIYFSVLKGNFRNISEIIKFYLPADLFNFIIKV